MGPGRSLPSSTHQSKRGRAESRAARNAKVTSIGRGVTSAPKARKIS
jgi:hypothetical protein